MEMTIKDVTPDILFNTIARLFKKDMKFDAFESYNIILKGVKDYETAIKIQAFCIIEKYRKYKQQDSEGIFLGLKEGEFSEWFSDNHNYNVFYRDGQFGMEINILNNREMVIYFNIGGGEINVEIKPTDEETDINNNENLMFKDLPKFIQKDIYEEVSRKTEQILKYNIV